jgi:hypothetical protein
MNWGTSIGGIPSLGGPPERISLYGTECLLKSVVNSLSARAGGGSSGSKVAAASLEGRGEACVGESGWGEGEAESVDWEGEQAERIHPAMRIHTIQFLNIDAPFIRLERNHLESLTLKGKILMSVYLNSMIY